MGYTYPQHKFFFYGAAGICFISGVEHYKEIGKVLAGGADETFVFLLCQKIFLIPLIILLIGLYLKKICIVTSNSGINFSSFLNKANFVWDEIRYVERVNWNIKVRGESKAFSFRPFITSPDSKIKINPLENIFKNCELLKEIYLKAQKAEFKNFPEDTFNS